MIWRHFKEITGIIGVIVILYTASNWLGGDAQDNGCDIEFGPNGTTSQAC